MKHRQDAFSLIENLMTVALVSLLSLGLIHLVVFSAGVAADARERTTAAMVMEGKIEAIRSSSWEQITRSNSFLPSDFLATNNGVVYVGTITTNAPLSSESYKDEILQVRVAVTWQSRQRQKSAEMATFMSAYGFSIAK